MQRNRNFRGNLLHCMLIKSQYSKNVSLSTFSALLFFVSWICKSWRAIVYRIKFYPFCSALNILFVCSSPRIFMIRTNPDRGIPKSLKLWFVLVPSEPHCELSTYRMRQSIQWYQQQFWQRLGKGIKQDTDFMCWIFPR